MRTARFPAPVLALALGLTACGTDGPLAPATETVAAGMHDVAHATDAASRAARSTLPPARPLRGACTITGVQFVSMVPLILNQASTALCHTSLLGRVAVFTQQQINVATGVQTAEAVWTTASGDRLFTTSLGTAVPTGPGTIRFSGVTTIAGGTGRFLNAAGSVQVEGTADNTAGTGSFTYEGSLQFDASNAAHR
jgi:predicted small lipoprotein YifL